MLKQNGSAITGTVGPTENDQHMAVKGKIDGDKTTLNAEDEGRAVTFDLVLAADRISGDMNMVHSGQTAQAKIDVKRAEVATHVSGGNGVAISHIFSAHVSGDTLGPSFCVLRIAGHDTS